jgi:hypothetical protein
MMTRPICGILAWLARPGSKLAHAHAGVKNDPVADQCVREAGSRPDGAVAADPHARPDHRIGGDKRAGADLCAGADHGGRIDDDAAFQPRAGVDDGARRDAGGAKQALRP